jgi:hypothetical protein
LIRELYLNYKIKELEISLVNKYLKVNKSMQLAIASVAILMLLTGSVYLFVAVGEIAEGVEEHEAEPDESIEGVLVETALFATVGGAYIPVGLWAISSRNSSRTPYFLAIIGSGSLIILYVLSRTVDLPVVGIQDDMGFIDILSKVLQSAIIAASAYIIVEIRKQKNLASLRVN